MGSHCPCTAKFKVRLLVAPPNALVAHVGRAADL